MSDYEKNISFLIKEMSSCLQSEGQTVYQHGESVSEFFEDLRLHVLEGRELKNTWKFPEWAKNKNLWKLVLPLNIVKTYQIFHDCGKPFCKEIDDNGKVHFPGHEVVSFNKWISIGGDPIVGSLISMDMDIHRIKAIEMEDFSKRSEAATLLLTGLSEINSNANMFGGIESISFKSKYKHIDRRGKNLIKLLKIEE